MAKLKNKVLRREYSQFYIYRDITDADNIEIRLTTKYIFRVAFQCSTFIDHIRSYIAPHTNLKIDLKVLSHKYYGINWSYTAAL